MKKIGLIFGLILILCSITGILLETRFRNDLCIQRFGARYFNLSKHRTLDAADGLREKGTPESLQEAIVLYREALSRDSVNPFRWSDLGLALLDAGRIDEARRCYLRAVELGPNNIPTLISAMDFHIRAREPREALRNGLHILEKYPEAASDLIFPKYIESDFDFSDTLNYGIPRIKTIAQAYARYVIKNNDVARAEMCWNWMVYHSLADDKFAGVYLNFLIRAGAPEKAWRAWLWTISETARALTFKPISYTIPALNRNRRHPLSIGEYRQSRARRQYVTRQFGIREEGLCAFHSTAKRTRRTGMLARVSSSIPAYTFSKLLCVQTELLRIRVSASGSFLMGRSMLLEQQIGRNSSRQLKSASPR